jgi:RNA polymerase sigma-70 factor (ECF subfamily)
VSEEHRLVERLAGGDEGAFDALARSLERSLYSHACRLLRDEVQAEDAVQDALLLAYRGRATFRGGSFKAWVFRILTNRCLDLIRETKRRPTVPLDPPMEDESDDPVMQWADPAPDIETVVIGHEMVRLVEEALAAVPAEQRAAVMLRDVQGFDYEEIARITNTELGTVKSRIHRGRIAVRNYLVARGWRAGNPPGPGGVQAST